jgi:hypothetical protein
MKKTKMVMSIGIPLILVALMIPAIVEAGSIKVWPDQVKPISPLTPYYHSIAGVTNNIFEVPLALPVGARIIKVSYYHLGGASPAETRVVLRRLKLGGDGGEIADQSSTDATSTIITVDVPITGDPIVKAGYRYYLVIECTNGNSYFMGAKIIYQ